MPSESGKQHRLMAMVAHDPAAAKRLGIPQSVGEDFVKADQAAGKHFPMKDIGPNRGNASHNDMVPHPDAAIPTKGGRVPRGQDAPFVASGEPSHVAGVAREPGLPVPGARHPRSELPRGPKP